MKMDTRLQTTALMIFLEERSSVYYGKVDEIEQAVRGWLSYIPHSFPHYTRHTIEHSIEIIEQLSSLLFNGKDPDQPVVELSPTEAFILVASAYLHDAGMVASDREKSEILLSDEWQKWIASEGGAARWQQIHQFRQGDQPADESLRHFLADIQTRFLLAEFIRRSHHCRTSEILTLHQNSLGRFAFDDPHLLQAINEVCVAHGLKKHELEDRARFPNRRDIRGDQVNLCFLAILLRIADLLDISHDRSCALLLNAASPIPADSRAHWTQYQRITHRLTAPDRIEVTAACENQEEHRYLRDWFQWLEDEVKNATVLSTHWQRHREWRPPLATLQGPDPTIEIQKAPGATYIFGDWKLELDHEAILERLVYDVHERHEAFIRELIQNALDAARCRMYSDYQAAGLEPPEYPTQFPEKWRQRYPVQLTLEEREFINDLSGESEKRQVLIVEDYGIGMDQEIIQKYFLQIGRSYYITDEFRRRFKFNPTSRFGVGFLSVFAVSNHVEVETYKPESGNGPLRLILTGPCNYLLMERGQRPVSGTRIEIVLRNPLATGELIELVSGWCKRVEFPVQVHNLENEITILAERPEDCVYEMPLVTDPEARFVVRAFPVNRPGVEGELYVFAYIKGEVESWVDWKLAQEYASTHPKANEPEFPSSYVCINGLLAHKFDRKPLGVRLDYRGVIDHMPLSRIVPPDWGKWQDNAIISRWQEILEQHLVETLLAQKEGAWIYKLKLAEIFSIPGYWEKQDGLIRIFQEGQKRLISLVEIQGQPVIATIIRTGGGYSDGEPTWNEATPALFGGDIQHYLPYRFGVAIFDKRFIEKICWIDRGYIALFWRQGKSDIFTLEDFPDQTKIFYSFYLTYGSVFGSFSTSIPIVIFNKNHPFVHWLLSFREACLKRDFNLDEEQFNKLFGLFRYISFSLEKLENYLFELRRITGLPDYLKPPDLKLTRDMFDNA